MTKAVLAGLCAALSMTTLAQDTKLAYPETKKVEVVEELHGVKIADPYRWLEDPNSDETKAWIKAQNEVTFKFLESIPERESIRNRLTELWNYERYGNPQKRGKYYFYTRNDGLQNQAVLYVSESLTGEPRVLLDPNKLSEDGTVALSSTNVSDDGRYLAYSISRGGSDWQEFYVRDVETGKDLADKIEWAKFTGAAWAVDGKGFYYSRYDAPKAGEALQGVNYFQKLYYHRLGTKQSEDELIYERPDQKEWGFGGSQTEDGRYLIISVWQGTHRENNIFYKDLKAKEGNMVELLPGFTASYSFLGNDASVFYFLTDKDAPNQRIVAIDTRHPEPPNWKTVVAETKENIESASLLGDRFYVTYLKDAYSQVRVFDLHGKQVQDIDLPGIGSVSGFSGKRKDKETFYAYATFNQPTMIYRYDLVKGESDVFKAPKLLFDPTLYQTRQVFFTSKDGTRVPMFVVHKVGLKLDGTNPTLMYGYGGFNQAQSPYFSVGALTWMEMGGVWASVNTRGGSEYGKAWHDGGRLKNKQNVFDDFIAAAEWLIANKYTQPSKLAMTGGSNGGLLVGAVLNQRPDLFGAALPAVGVMDMLRFHKFTIGWAWVSDYGSPDKPEEFEVLRAYSPLHNIKPQKHPAVLVTTGDHDDRVVPAHSFKYAAALQAAQQGDAPVLIRIETSAGHGAGKPTAKIIEEAADRYAFLVKALNMRVDRS